MGFQDISSFNLAMLAKQAWRLIHNEQSLFYRVYKARYFPNFLDGKIGLYSVNCVEVITGCKGCGKGRVHMVDWRW